MVATGDTVVIVGLAPPDVPSPVPAEPPKLGMGTTVTLSSEVVVADLDVGVEEFGLSVLVRVVGPEMFELL